MHEVRSITSTAVLDEAHVGDIQGALGTIRLEDVARRHTWKHGVLTFLAIVGHRGGRVCIEAGLPNLPAVLAGHRVNVR